MVIYIFNFSRNITAEHKKSLLNWLVFFMGDIGDSWFRAAKKEKM